MIKENKLVVVLGMHRSGTSALTRGLQVMGVSLGANMMPAAEASNPKGFWEDVDINALNIEIFNALGRDWYYLSAFSPEDVKRLHELGFFQRAVDLLCQKAANAQIFGFKDPRVAKLLPFWQQVFEHCGYCTQYILALRNPLSVVKSLAKRDQLDETAGYFLWLGHVIPSLIGVVNCNSVVVDYDRLMTNPAHELERIAAHLGLLVDAVELHEYQSIFLDENLRHTSYSIDELKSCKRCPDIVREIYGRLLEVASGQKTLHDDSFQDIVTHWSEEFERLSLLFSVVDSLYATLVVHDDHIASLSQSVTDRNQQIENLTQCLSDRKEQIASLSQSVSDRNQQIQSLSQSVSDRDARIDSLSQSIKDCSEKNVMLNLTVADREDQIVTLLKRYDSSAQLGKALVLKCVKFLRLDFLYRKILYYQIRNNRLVDSIFYLEKYEDVREAGVDPVCHYIEYGWKEGRDPSSLFSTKFYLDSYADVRLSGINPLIHYWRYGIKENRRINNFEILDVDIFNDKFNFIFYKNLFYACLKEENVISKFIKIVKNKGLKKGVSACIDKIKRIEKSILPSVSSGVVGSTVDRDVIEHKHSRIVPFYLDPYIRTLPKIAEKKVAVHFHLFLMEMADQVVSYLKNIPVKFDLYVSIPDGVEGDTCLCLLRRAIPLVDQIVIENVPNRGSDLAPFIVQFGRVLADYDYVAHFHTGRIAHNEDQENSFDDLMNVLCGSSCGITQIFNLLDSDAKIVFTSGMDLNYYDNGLSDSLDDVRVFLAKHGGFKVDDFLHVEYSKSGMFWAKAFCIKNFLELPLKYLDFPEDILTSVPTAVHILQRLVFMYTTRYQGRVYRLESPELSFEDRLLFENQYDFRTEIVHETVKVLAYYLPQFHPTPENDVWHGSGFTEWHKVKAATPLFHGHYQQHVPHSDIGYYILDDPSQLQRQAELMHKSGVHGLIFYHYWFSGKLILEKPAQMLLENSQINLPFCFCWANENWTRRWDGNENEILLGQVYSKNDACDFIQYLIPFFKDARYITVEGRPVLFVYRPSSMEFCLDYIEIWRQECERCGLKAPYLVATLTRGATSPYDYGMDAAVERVLHDWTDGAVPDIKNQLRPYWPINGSVLNYREVVDYYINQKIGNDFPLFRSLVPAWDNTARYGSNAYVVHGFTTEKMQQWAERLIDYSERCLPGDRRFLIINAWNEWAEGAHVEPDTRFGYGYLNAIGRALSGHSFNEIDYIKIDEKLSVALDFGSQAIARLSQCSESKRKFFRCLASSTVFSLCQVCTDDSELFAGLAREGVRCSFGCSEVQYRLAISDIILVQSNTIELLLKMAIRHPYFNISATPLNDPNYTHGKSVISFQISSEQRSDLELRPCGAISGFKCCPRANYFVLSDEAVNADLLTVSRISTIVRFHRDGNEHLLENAIFSLLAQAQCHVQLYLCLQDVDDEQVEALRRRLYDYPWAEKSLPIIRRYQSTSSNSDLRSLMLNDALKAVGSGYVAFLDYDDILFPDAYRILIDRLLKTGTNATFGRVYSKILDLNSYLNLKREVHFVYGDSYEDFVYNNHAPLHSFMINLDKIDLNRIVYYEDMKYMEDYFLTLQVFTKNETDWESLKFNIFIGDYIHYDGGNNTLALNCSKTKSKLLEDCEYIKCEQRINSLRKKLKRDC